MTISEQIAQVVKQVARDMAAGLKDAKTPGDQDVGTDMVCSMHELARLIKDMDYEEAKATILDHDNPARQQIIDAMAAKGIFV